MRKITRRWVVGMLVLGLTALALGSPAPAFAHHGRGHFWGGFAIGAVTGAIVSHAFVPHVYAAPPAVVYQPAPVYYQPAPVYYPATTCYDSWVDGYWYYGTWVGAHWQRTCR